MTDTKYCPACERELPVSEFAKNARRPDGLQSACKPCRKATRKPDQRTSELGLLDDALAAALAERRQQQAEADAKEEAELSELDKTNPEKAASVRGWREYERRTRFW